MAVEFTTIYAIGAVGSSNPAHGKVYLIQHYVIKFVSDLRQVGTLVSCTNKTDHHHITKILLKMAVKNHNAKPNSQYVSVVSTMQYKSYLTLTNRFWRTWDTTRFFRCK